MQMASDLGTLLRKEMEDIIHNPVKEAILLLSRQEVEYILWVNSQLHSSPLATHASVSLYAEVNRCIYLSKNKFEWWVESPLKLLGQSHSKA